MSWPADIRTYLGTLTAITTIVGSSNSLRVYFHNIPQDKPTLPAVTLQQLSGGHEHMLSGGAGYADARVETAIWASSAATARTLADAMRTAMQGYRGTMGDSTIQACLLEDESELPPDPPQDGSDRYTYHTTMSWLFKHTESIPTF